MKFVLQILTIGFLAFGLQAISLQTTPKLNIFSMFIETDYSPTALAFSRVKYIQQEYRTFKEQVAKNTSIDYAKCVDFIKIQKCNNIDQWQSVIDELRLANSNSIEVEVPFLEKRKEEKIARLKAVLLKSQEYDDRLQQIARLLIEHKKELIESSRQIKVMYKVIYNYFNIKFIAKLPEPKETIVMMQKQGDPVVQALNADGKFKCKLIKIVPDVAKTELAKANEQYDIADQSIQASTAQDVLNSASQKMIETLEHLQTSFEAKIEDLRGEKQLLKDDILRLRALMEQEKAVQQKNNEKIVEMKARIDGCKGKPTNIEKDCEPINLKAAKLYTEIDIINSRTNVLYKELDVLVKENINADQMQKEKEEHTKRVEGLEAKKEEELNLLINNNSTEFVYVPSEPKEQSPIVHLPEVNAQDNQKSEKGEKTG